MIAQWYTERPPKSHPEWGGGSGVSWEKPHSGSWVVWAPRFKSQLMGVGVRSLQPIGVTEASE